MTKINAVIIDDEKLSADALIWELDGLEYDIEILGIANSATEGIRLIEEKKPDLVFLDIEMPVMNGFDMLRSMDRINFSIIFTTAYDQYAINAFEINALDYLLKPVSADKLQQALDRFLSQKTSDTWVEKLEQLQRVLKQQNPCFNKIAIPTQEGLEFLVVDKIVRCSSDSNYTNIYLADEKPIMVSKTLGNIQERINSELFVRVHKSHLINLNYVRKYVKAEGGYIVMDDGTQVPVSRRKKDNLAQILTR